MAPELVMQCYDEKADLWSVGMLAYQLLTGRFPFWEDVRNETLSDVWKVRGRQPSGQPQQQQAQLGGLAARQEARQARHQLDLQRQAGLPWKHLQQVAAEQLQPQHAELPLAPAAAGALQLQYQHQQPTLLGRLGAWLQHALAALGDGGNGVFGSSSGGGGGLLSGLQGPHHKLRALWLARQKDLHLAEQVRPAARARGGRMRERERERESERVGVSE